MTLTRSASLFLLSSLLGVAPCKGDPSNATTTAKIGPGGGTVSLEDGASVEIPDGALSEEVEISISVDEDAFSGMVLSSPLYVFEPHGLEFNMPVTVSIPFEGGGDPLVHWSTDRESFDGLSTRIASGVASAEVWHFSWGASAAPVSTVCDDPTAGEGPPGTVAIEGSAFGTPVQAIDAIATREETQWVESSGRTRYRSVLTVRLTDYAGACAAESVGRDVEGSSWVYLTVVEESETAPPGMPPSQLYTLDASSRGLDEPRYTGTGIAGICDADCNGCANTITAATGWLDLVVSTEQVSGTFEYSDKGTSLSGVFDAPICHNENEPERCCHTP